MLATGKEDKAPRLHRCHILCDLEKGCLLNRARLPSLLLKDSLFSSSYSPSFSVSILAPHFDPSLPFF